MSSVIKFSQSNELSLPLNFSSNDTRTSDNLLFFFIENFSKVNDIVFDPFAGFGTTLYISEKLNRQGYGIEFLKDKVEYVKSILKNSDNIHWGDALKLSSYENFPNVDFCFCSPPYMIENIPASYPFGIIDKDIAYKKYLENIELAFYNLKSILNKDALVVIESCNIINNGHINTLAWDMAKAISRQLKFYQEYIIEWVGEYKNSNFGLTHSYCFLFKN